MVVESVDLFGGTSPCLQQPPLPPLQTHAHACMCSTCSRVCNQSPAAMLATCTPTLHYCMIHALQLLNPPLKLGLGGPQQASGRGGWVWRLVMWAPVPAALPTCMQNQNLNIYASAGHVSVFSCCPAALWRAQPSTNTSYRHHGRPRVGSMRPVPDGGPPAAGLRDSCCFPAQDYHRSRCEQLAGPRAGRGEEPSRHTHF